MAILFAAAGIGLGVISFRMKDSPSLTGYGLIAACICIVAAFSFWGASGGGGCYIDWDARSNSEVCD